MRTYTPELKVTVAKEAIETGCSPRSLVEKYDIGGESTVRGWIKLYKENGESYFFRNQIEENEQTSLNISENTIKTETAIEKAIISDDNTNNNLPFSEKSSFNEKVKGAANTIKIQAASVGGNIVKGTKAGSRYISQRIKNLNLSIHFPKKEKKEKEEK